MNIDLSNVVRALSSDGVTVTVDRPNADTFDTHGRSVAQTFTTTSLTECSVQATRGVDLDKMPEGIHGTELLTVFAPGFVFQVKDRLTITGRGVYQVIHADPWGSPLGGFGRCIAKQLNAAEPRP